MIIAARDAGQDPIAAIEQHLPWTRFVKSVHDARALTQPEIIDNRTAWLGRYTTIRKFAPALLETLSFQGADSASSLLKALDVLRKTWRAGKRSLPASVPTGFIRRSWRPFVFQNGGIDRGAYEICAIWELRERLRSGDIWVEGSRQYQALEATLIPKPSLLRSPSSNAQSSLQSNWKASPGAKTRGTNVPRPLVWASRWRSAFQLRTKAETRP